MSAVPIGTFRRWLGRLDAEAFGAFVAELYARRGRSPVTRSDGAVVLDDGRVLFPVASRWRLRTPSLPPDADALVAADPTARLARLADRRGVRVVTPDELRNLALYGIDRRDTERLFESYFDASPVVPAPEPSVERGSLLDGVDDASLASVAAVVLVALVVAALLGPFGPGVAPASDDAAQAESGPVVVGPADTAADGTEGALFPPGLGPTGVTDAEQLADAHADAVAGRSYRLLVRQSGTEDRSGRVWRGVWQQAEVETPREFRYTVTGYVEVEEANGTADGDAPTDTDGDGDALVQYSAYSDGEQVTVRTEGRNASFSRYPVPVDRYGHGPFERRAEAAIERYLDSSEATISREDRLRYPFTVVATGTPHRLSNVENVSNYRAEATVGTDGFVAILVVSYDLRTADGTREVTYRMEYASLDAVTVSRPAWYERATNETAPDAATTATPANDSTAPGTETASARTESAPANNRTVAENATTTGPETTSRPTPTETRRPPSHQDAVRRPTASRVAGDGG